MPRLLLISTCVAVLAAAVVLTAIEDGGFRRDDVVRAFREEGFALDAPPGQSPYLAGGEVLLPEQGEPFTVFVWRNDTLAKRYFEPYDNPEDAPETFDLRHRNVMVISDSGLTAEQRTRLRTALERLGDREPPSASTNTDKEIDLFARCGSRGAPVTLAKLVRVFRANGVTLDIHRRGCERPASDPHHPDATNAGLSGLEQRPGIYRKEGHVLCRVVRVPHARNREVEVVKYPTDTETQVGVLNVGCAVYPSDAASEKQQVNRVRRALEVVARVT